MEQSEYLYNEWEMDKLQHVFGKILAMLLIFCMLLTGGLPESMFGSGEDPALSGKISGISGADSVFDIMDMSMSDCKKALASRSGQDQIHPDGTLLREKTEDKREDVSGLWETTSEKGKDISSAAMLESVGDESIDAEMSLPEIQEQENLSETVANPDSKFQDAIEIIPDAEQGTDIGHGNAQDSSGETDNEDIFLPEEDSAADEMETVGGFLIDEYGIIRGISDSQAVVEDGVMILPSEGCSGIGAGALSDAPAGIIEVHIPANITTIQPGAFLGLNEVLWYDVPSSQSGYETIDGILFSENGSCLLAFPSARIGAYAVPSGVVRFAADAFAGSALSKLDLRAADVTDTGNLPDSIEILR